MPDPSPPTERTPAPETHFSTLEAEREEALELLDTALVILKNAAWGGGAYWALREKLERARAALGRLEEKP